MEAPLNDSKIVRPFVPSLFHFSLVKVALPLFKSHDQLTWCIVLDEMKNTNPAEFNKARSENLEANKAKEELLVIPAHLRLKILETIMGMHASVVQWRLNHSFLETSDTIYQRLFFKADGSVDSVRSAQQLILNQDINIERRFDLACSYFLSKSVKTLWAEMKVSGKAAKSISAYNPVSRFWVRRMRRKHRVPWKYGLRLHLDLPDQCFGGVPDQCFGGVPGVRFSAFFPSLQPTHREKFLSSLSRAASDDFLLCLYKATKEEELEIISRDIRKLLLLYLDFPLQSFFLDVAEKLWNFMDYFRFKTFLQIIYFHSMSRKDFDYGQLFMDFWERSPDNLKEEVKAHPVFYNEIMSSLDIIRKKRKGEIKEREDSENERNEVPCHLYELIEVNGDFFCATFLSSLKNAANQLQ